MASKLSKQGNLFRRYSTSRPYRSRHQVPVGSIFDTSCVRSVYSLSAASKGSNTLDHSVYSLGLRISSGSPLSPVALLTHWTRQDAELWNGRETRSPLPQGRRIISPVHGFFSAFANSGGRNHSQSASHLFLRSENNFM